MLPALHTHTRTPNNHITNTRIPNKTHHKYTLSQYTLSQHTHIHNPLTTHPHNTTLSHPLTMHNPLRYALGDPVESWLHQLLCLDAAEHVPPPPPRLPHPDECELYYVHRDTLFSFHKVGGWWVWGGCGGFMCV